MSLSDDDPSVWFKPNGDYYGSVAGKVEIQLQPGSSLTLTAPTGELNFPTGEGFDVTAFILTWEVSR